jgi:hypothetical protein
MIGSLLPPFPHPLPLLYGFAASGNHTNAKAKSPRTLSAADTGSHDAVIFITYQNVLLKW